MKLKLGWWDKAQISRANGGGIWVKCVLFSCILWYKNMFDERPNFRNCVYLMGSFFLGSLSSNCLGIHNWSNVPSKTISICPMFELFFTNNTTLNSCSVAGYNFLELLLVMMHFPIALFLFYLRGKRENGEWIYIELLCCDVAAFFCFSKYNQAKFPIQSHHETLYFFRISFRGLLSFTATLHQLENIQWEQTCLKAKCWN